MTKISKLRKVIPRTVWSHEAHDFTRWLSDNLDHLGESIGIKLTLVDREVAAGPFSADILAEDTEGNPVVIENQLEQTNHDHLGKLITYMSNLGAKTAIWIASDPRPEHEKAIHWLNETLPADTSFYLLKIEAVQIDESDPAPLFTIIAGPTEEGRQVGTTKKQLAERHVLRQSFWKQLLDRSKNKTPLFANISPGLDNWISTGAGRSGFGFAYVILKKGASVELYIDTGDGEENKRYFGKLEAQKAVIENLFGGPLLWQRLDNRRASRIRYVIGDRGLDHSEEWTETQDKMIDAMIRLTAALKPEIINL